MGRVRRDGLYFPKTHFSWLLKHGMLVPMERNVHRSYFSPLQLPQLDIIQQIQRDTLAYPISKDPFDRKGIIRLRSAAIKKNQAITWQRFFLLNKDQILRKQNDWSEILRLLHQISALNKAVENAARDWFKEDQDTIKVMAHWESARKRLISGEARPLAKQILEDNQNIPLQVVRAWATSILPQQIIRHNPLYIVASAFSQSQESFKEACRYINTPHESSGEKIAEFYVSLIELIRFYFRCLGQKPFPNVERLTSVSEMRKGRHCAICGDYFIPRTKGRKNILCDKKRCQKTRDRQKRKLRWGSRPAKKVKTSV